MVNAAKGLTVAVNKAFMTLVVVLNTTSASATEVELVLAIAYLNMASMEVLKLDLEASRFNLLKEFFKDMNVVL
jgi:hypothetical protein